MTKWKEQDDKVEGAGSQVKGQESAKRRRLDTRAGIEVQSAIAG